MGKNKKGENGIIIFKTEDEKISVNVRFDEETVWLTLDQMANLFERDKSTISRHIKNIFEEGELTQSATVAYFATVQTPLSFLPTQNRFCRKDLINKLYVSSSDFCFIS